MTHVLFAIRRLLTAILMFEDSARGRPCLDSLTGETHFPLKIFFSTALVCEGFPEGEARNPLLTFCMANLSLN